MDRLHSVLAGIDEGADKAQAYESQLRNAYHRTLNMLVRDAARRFARHSLHASARWGMPDRDEVFPEDQARAALFASTQPIRVKIVSQMTTVGLASVGVSFAARNPLVQHLLANLGTRITEITARTRNQIMASLADSYEQGLSIPHAARAMSATVRATNITRSTLIARTELIGAKAGSSLAVVQITGAASYKVWLATEDARTRQDHSDADGQTVPLGSPFDVGGYPMDHPGDQSAPAEEVCNCRCTLTYADSP